MSKSPPGTSIYDVMTEENLLLTRQKIVESVQAGQGRLFGAFGTTTLPAIDQALSNLRQWKEYIARTPVERIGRR